MSNPVEFVDLDWQDRALRIEYQWLGERDGTQPLIVFLHEGLGSRAMWRDFPHRLCRALGCRGLVYSRPGYGRSTPRAAGQSWGVDFMHQQAHGLLPLLLRRLGVDATRHPPWLFGHSDGASIALLYAARFPRQVGALVLLAPHILVEDISIASIERARSAYLETDLRQKLARYHDDPDSAFRGWNDIWLHPAFRQWSIEDEIATIRCPLLALQGAEDEYGTLEQVYGIARRVAAAQVAVLAECGHSPQRDQPARLIEIVQRFAADNLRGGVTPK